MLKRLEKYANQGLDSREDALLEEIYVPEMTKGTAEFDLLLEDELAESFEDPFCDYQCTLCPELKLKNKKEVKRHLESKNHKKREKALQNREEPKYSMIDIFGEGYKHVEEEPVAEPPKKDKKKEKKTKKRRTEEAVVDTDDKASKRSQQKKRLKELAKATKQK